MPPLSFPAFPQITAFVRLVRGWITLVAVHGMIGTWTAAAAPVSLIPKSDTGRPLEAEIVPSAEGAIRVWKSNDPTGTLNFGSGMGESIPEGSGVYVEVAYVDDGSGKLEVQLISKGKPPIKPDRFLGLTRSNSARIVTARMRLSGIAVEAGKDWSVRIACQGAKGRPLAVQRVSLQGSPFADKAFKLVISDPWLGSYQGPRVAPKDNTTLKGKVMAGYQGWFRTPNDLEGRGWSHWGDIQGGTFSVDMWPDVSQYPSSVLEKAAEVKLKSGKPALLFSSTWPAVVDTHFRWMREHDIDGVFLQRFVSERFHAISGGPEWVLSNVRASANREGRIWAVEYDVSGCPEAKLLERMTKDWKWLVDDFRLLDDPHYAREGGKPVVFIWGLPFPNRNISSGVANAVADFFRNDPKYGGNHLIGGIPSDWRKMDAAWQEHFRKYDSVLTWMPKLQAADQADFTQRGQTYLPHVKPGFSWANLKHLPSGDESASYKPRGGGRFYWEQLTDVARAGADRLFVGMFDEYDEATAIMPMSDDAPRTPERPGVGATFYHGDQAQENGEFVRLPVAELELGATSPSRKTGVDHFFVKMGGQITFPAAGAYTFSVQGAAGDDIELFLNGRSVLRSNALKDTEPNAGRSVTVAKGEPMAFRLQCRHRTGKGKLLLLWEAPGMARQPVPASALHDAWGRFITNEGRPADWWLQLTKFGKEMMTGKRSVSDLPPGIRSWGN